MAERWAELITDAPQLPFFRRAIERFGQPALDLACGTGRLLLPLLRQDIDIDGCDLSADMLSHCRNKAEREGLRPQLYEQPMHALQLSRKYRTIYICDSFGLAGGRSNDLETLRRCCVHLEERGALLVNLQAEYTSGEDWALWSREARAAFPQPWPEQPRRQVGPDGSEHVAYFRILDMDPLEQTYTREVRLEKWRSGELIASEQYTLRGDMYLKNELRLMLQVAGFREITVTGDYTDQIATADSEELVFTAVR